MMDPLPFLLGPPVFVVTAVITAVWLARQSPGTRVRKVAAAAGRLAVVCFVLFIPSAVDDWLARQRPQPTAVGRSEVLFWFANVASVFGFITFVALVAVAGSLVLILVPRLLRWSLTPW